MIYRVGDLLLASTLFINAGAILNFAVEKQDGLTAKAKLFECIRALQVFRFVICLWNILMLIMLII